MFVAVDRLVQWDQGRGSHAEHGLPGPSTTWYFAEGATYPGFSLFYLLQNPGDALAHVTVTYLREPPLAPLVRQHEVPPHSRLTVWVNHDEAGPETPSTGAASSAVIASDVPIVAERAMYRSVPEHLRGRPCECRRAALRTSWYFAEGHTGPLFEQYLLLGNPGTSPVPVRVSYLLPTGPTPPVTYVVARAEPAHRAGEQRVARAGRLARRRPPCRWSLDADAPIVAERAMWWPGSSATWREAHVSLGAEATVRDDGRSPRANGRPGVDTYVLVANTGSTASTLRATLLREGATPLTADIPIAAGARQNIDVQGLFPQAFGTRFGMLVEPAPGAPAVSRWSWSGRTTPTRRPCTGVQAPRRSARVCRKRFGQSGVRESCSPVRRCVWRWWVPGSPA